MRPPSLEIDLLTMVDVVSGRRLGQGPATTLSPGAAGGFDYDGEHVAASSTGCKSARILVRRRLQDLPRNAGHCRLRLLERPVVKGRKLTARFSCHGLRVDCFARVLHKQGSRTFGSGLAEGGRVTLTVNREGIRALARRRSVRIIVRDAGREFQLFGGERDVVTSVRR